MLNGSRVRLVGCALLLIVLGMISACTPDGAPASTVTPARPAAVAPFGAGELGGLGGGALYVIAGPDPMSGNVWLYDLDRGESRRLTTNPPQYGVSWVSASSAGVAVADAASGVDRVGMLDGQGVREVEGGHVFSPAIDDRGRIGWVRPAELVAADGNRYEQVEVREPGADAPRVVYRQRGVDMGGVAWGPHGWLAVGSRRSDGDDVDPRILVFDGTGRLAHRLRPRLPDQGGAVWSPRAPGIAVWGFGNAEILTLSGGHTALPAGWRPICWRPDGDGLLMTRGNLLGLWRDGRLVTTVKTRAGAGAVFECSWVERPAPLGEG